MSKAQHPKCIEEVTPAWMTRTLRQAIGSDDLTVGRIEIESLGGEGRGFLSGVARVALGYETRVAGAPETVVVKLPTTEAGGREVAMTNDAYMRELRFYQDIAPHSAVRVPRCYLSSLDPAEGDYLLVMEDAKDWIAGDQVTGLSLANAEAALRMIARFHARWWDLPPTAELGWVPREISQSFRFFIERWPGFCDRHGDAISLNARQTGDRMVDSTEALATLIAASRHTLVHGDFRADNLMFGGPQVDDHVMVLDWQWLSRSIGAYDVARLVCGSLPTQLGHGHHRQLLGAWHRELVNCGVGGYSLDQAWRDYQTGLLQYTYLPVVCDEFFSHEGGRSRELLHALIDRVFHALTECQAIERLDQV